MATQKEIALWGAYNLGHIFKQNMQVVKMSEDSIHEQNIRHTCINSGGFIYLPKYQTCIQDYLKYYQVDVWGCPHCGKLYWYTQEIGQVIGDQAVLLRAYRKQLTNQGYDMNQIPPQTFYYVHMITDETPNYTVEPQHEDDDLNGYNNDDQEPEGDLGKLNNFTW